MIQRECAVEAGEKVEIAIHYKDPYKDWSIEKGIGERGKTFIRRHLAEVRDNFLSKSDMALGLVSRIRKAMH
jgi:hypothetical protein